MNFDTKAWVVYTPDAIRGLVGGILLSIEIATSALVVVDLEAFTTLGAPSLVADNACHGALVLGDEFVGDTTGGDGAFRTALYGLGDHPCTMDVNGAKVADGAGNQALGHPLNALCWLANALGKRGEILKKGDVVTTGVCVDELVLGKGGGCVRVDYGGLGEVTFDFAE